MDWEAVYREEAYGGPPPWNIGEPQPVISQLIAAGKPRGRVLDAGCGIGDAALELAAHGYDVVGIDTSAVAIASAQNSAAERGLQNVNFIQGDLTELSGFDGQFDTIVDCTLFHALPIDGRDGYLRSMNRSSTLGATMFMLVLTTDALPVGAPFPIPNLVTQDEVRALVTRYWQIDELRPAPVHIRLPAIPGLRHPFEVDTKGRVMLPALLIAARKVA